MFGPWLYKVVVSVETQHCRDQRGHDAETYHNSISALVYWLVTAFENIK